MIMKRVSLEGGNEDQSETNNTHRDSEKIVTGVDKETQLALPGKRQAHGDQNRNRDWSAQTYRFSPHY
jgi:hypothetical protein